jgi:hypothetical protein
MDEDLDRALGLTNVVMPVATPRYSNALHSAFMFTGWNSDARVFLQLFPALWSHAAAVKAPIEAAIWVVPAPAQAGADAAHSARLDGLFGSVSVSFLSENACRLSPACTDSCLRLCESVLHSRIGLLVLREEVGLGTGRCVVQHKRGGCRLSVGEHGPEEAQRSSIEGCARVCRGESVADGVA